MIKADEATMPGSTWSKTGDSEPVFILRAQDDLAPHAVRMWVTLGRIAGVKQAKLREALDLAAKMEEWQGRNASRVPD